MSLIVDYRRQQAAQAQLDQILKNPNSALLVHYSCESFYKTDGRSPRITSIAARRYGSGQTISFSIHKMAEIDCVPMDRIRDHYDALERKMLDEFYEFIAENAHVKWVHWNMRDENYGFEAIKRRYQVLGGSPRASVPEQNRIDLARLLVDRYGRDYTGHPRLESLVMSNAMTTTGFLNGQEESDAWDQGRFLDLHRSTLRKVDLFGAIISRVEDGSLKTQSGWLARVLGAVQAHPVISGLVLFGSLAGALAALVNGAQWLLS
ncbi:hypothetical protein [Terrihabitans rhizophilus]|uniref:Uncharacterized protein n=1 Tax=Terrihabitans rhizophilus TaxID=3092662 RepID=A0ABU4RNK7_9HYPH|nr:hypothetical protein [Terrihabitans sp. PJ23]MDX6806422.1 hypothetical protein [Terrihabitans sp. PJ23]